MTRFLPILFLLALGNCKKQADKTSLPKTPEKEIVQPQSAPKTEVLSPIEEKVKEQGLVDIQTVDASIWVDLKYASIDNFFGEDVYGTFKKAYLQREPAEQLKVANEQLQTRFPDYRLLVYDAVRPLAVQWILWEKLDSIPPKLRTNYVADPKKGSIHNYGCAVDLTIIDTKTLQPLDMGTKFDFFGYLAYPRKEAEMLEKGLLTKEQIANRQLLRDVMQAARYEGITSEWWHFNYYPRKVAEKKYKIVK